MQERYDYDGYGNAVVLTAGYGARATSICDWETLFASYRWDDESGLYQVRYRYYHPMVGCFISRAPKEWEYNLYRYVGNRPLIVIDPTGEPIPVLVVVGGLALAWIFGPGAAPVQAPAQPNQFVNPGFANRWQGDLAGAGLGLIAGASITFIVTGIEAAIVQFCRLFGCRRVDCVALSRWMHGLCNIPGFRRRCHRNLTCATMYAVMGATSACLQARIIRDTTCFRVVDVRHIREQENERGILIHC